MQSLVENMAWASLYHVSRLTLTCRCSAPAEKLRVDTLGLITILQHSPLSNSGPHSATMELVGNATTNTVTIRLRDGLRRPNISQSRIIPLKTTSLNG